MKMRLRVLLVFLALLILAFVLAVGVTGKIPGGGVDGIWFWSGLVTLIFATFYVEPHFNAPRNVLAHSVTVILVCLTSRAEFIRVDASLHWWYALFGYAAVMFAVSWTALATDDRDGPPTSRLNRTSHFTRTFATTFGSAKILYSGVFLAFLPILHDLSSPWVLAALVFWWVIVIAEPAKQLSRALDRVREGRAEVAQIFSAQSPEVFLARTYERVPALGVLDVVEFSFAPDRDRCRVRLGVVFDCYTLDTGHWLRIVQLETRTAEKAHEPNVVCRVDGIAAQLRDKGKEILGLVCEESDIRLLRFEVRGDAPALEEGDLVECVIGGRRVYYQIHNGVTANERLESRSESGFIRAEALQLGTWNASEGSFSVVGWVPEVSAPVRRALFETEGFSLRDSEVHLGTVPGTDIAVPIDLDVARTHHTAILGVTGSGKTFITLELLGELSKRAKVICIDFTGEYMRELANLTPTPLIDPAGLVHTEEAMAQKADLASTRGNASAILTLRKQIEEKLNGYVRAFIQSDSNVAILELPDMSNTSFILEFTQMFLDAVFRFAKQNEGQKICLVIEEAHTVIPETNSLGDFGDYSANKAIVNKIAQIALQGRKYGVGFWVIAQRTANVSKTVLTQCNSLICFRAFDETSMRFLENHLGRQVAATIPQLRKYHAVAVGNAFRGTVPVIVDLKRSTG